MTRTSVLLTSLAAGALLAGAGLGLGRAHDARTDREYASTPIGRWFTPVEHAGIIAQLSNINYSASAQHAQWGHPGGRLTRALNIGGRVGDPSGRRVYRIAAPPRLIEITDAGGRDLSDLAPANTYPAHAHQMSQWFWPTGSSSTHNFSVNLNNLPRMSKTLARVAVELDVEVAAAIEEVSFEPGAMDRFEEIAPGFLFRVSRFTVDPQGRLSMGFEYRAEGDEFERPVLARVEVIGTDGQPIFATDRAPEIFTRDATLGGVPDWSASLGQREVREIRVRLVTEVERGTILLEERNLPMLGW